MDLGIQNKFALVTGASQGIGLAIATELAREGARVVLVARSRQKLKAVQRDLPGGAKRHSFFAMDLTSAGNPAKLAKSIIGKLGAPEIVVHNLGGSLGVRDAFASSAEWKKVWQYNLGIAIELNCLLIPPMVQKKWGRIVHLSTYGTLIHQGNAAYVSAKSALNMYVKVAGREVAKHNVVLSAIAPGAIYTEGRYFAKLQKENPAALEQYYRDHLAAGRLGTAKEIGILTTFLCSEHAAFMTGSIVAMDGGGL